MRRKQEAAPGRVSRVAVGSLHRENRAYWLAMRFTALAGSKNRPKELEETACSASNPSPTRSIISMLKMLHRSARSMSLRRSGSSRFI